MAKRKISARKLREKLDYNPETGEFFTKPRKVGYKALVGLKRDYPVEKISLGTGFKGDYSHRLAWLWMTGSWPSGEVDHINNDSMDNRWCNLRLATRSQNVRNSGGDPRNTSGYTGAYWAKDRKRWFSRIGKKGGYLGTFVSAEEAGEAYRKAAIEMYGEFAHSRFRRF